MSDDENKQIKLFDTICDVKSGGIAEFSDQVKRCCVVSNSSFHPCKFSEFCFVET